MRLPAFGYTILIVAILGFVINVSALIFLIWRHKTAKNGGNDGKQRVQSTLFHHLLTLLAACDILVVICCALAYGLPDAWPEFLQDTYPHLGPYVVPITHMAVMSSVYSTVLISFERYVRICYICQLRPSKWITVDNFKYYVTAIIFGPIIFYLPKFFEVRANLVTTTFQSQVNCSRLNGFIGMNDRIKQYILNKLSVEDIEYFNDLLHSCKDENSYKNVTREEQELRVQPTELRSNPVYYRLYYVHLNTIFASLIPLVSLLYLNIATVKALKKMAEEQAKDIEVGEYSPRDSLVTQHLLKAQEEAKRVADYNRLQTRIRIISGKRLERSVSSSVIFEVQNAQERQQQEAAYFTRITRRCSSVEKLDILFKTRNELIVASSHQEAKKSKKSINESKSKKVDILVTACSTPNLSSPALPPPCSSSKSQFLLPEDQINLNQITFVKSDYKASKKVPFTEPLIEPLEEVYSVSFHRKARAENSRLSRRRSTLMTVLDSQDSSNSSRRQSKTLEFKNFLNKRRCSYTKTNHRSGSIISQTGQQALEDKENIFNTTQEEAIRKPLTSHSDALVDPKGGIEIAEHPESSEVRRSSGANGDSRRVTSPSLRRDSIDNNRREQKLARTSILIVWLFLFCHIWKLFPTAYEAGYSTDGLSHRDWPFWVLIVEYLSHLLITLNSTINFLIYAVM